MIAKVSKARFKKIVIAFVLLSIAQWYPDGFVICYGADGHIAVESPAVQRLLQKKRTRSIPCTR